MGDGTEAVYDGALLRNAIKITMDGRGAWRDNIFVERLWRSVKYEEVYLHAYDSAAEARASIGRYLTSTPKGLITALTGGRRITPALFNLPTPILSAAEPPAATHLTTAPTCSNRATSVPPQSQRRLLESHDFAPAQYLHVKK